MLVCIFGGVIHKQFGKIHQISDKYHPKFESHHGKHFEEKKHHKKFEMEEEDNERNFD